MLWVKDFRNFGRSGGWLAETWVEWPDGLRQMLTSDQPAPVGTSRQTTLDTPVRPQSHKASPATLDTPRALNGGVNSDDREV